MRKILVLPEKGIGYGVRRRALSMLDDFDLPLNIRFGDTGWEFCIGPQSTAQQTRIALHGQDLPLPIWEFPCWSAERETYDAKGALDA
ncbi:MAG TPA: hypothetical protein VHL08_08440 [Dongiaceae bacterium]|nr:hypothetical protein [Dongiaceae bacterium]